MSQKTKKQKQRTKDYTKYKGRRGQERDKDREEVKSEETSRKGWNHPSWYIPDENVRKTVGSFSFSQTLGVPEILSEDAPMLSISYDTNMKVGTVMSIETFPYPGDDSVVSYYAIPAISTAARKLYTAISAVNSKTTQYTAPTLSKAILCVGDLISLISNAQRAIGIAFTYNPRNREVPRQLIAAMGFDPDDVLDNLPIFRNQLNTVITMANNIRMPKDISYFTKCWDMYSNVYEDAGSAMAQYYVMRPAGYLILNETSTPADVEFNSIPSMTSTTAYIRILKNVVKALLDSTTINYVFTDVVNYTLKQGGELIGFAYVPELYSILPQVDLTFLTQIHNMSWGYFDLSAYTISEDVLNNVLTTSNIWRYKIGTHTNAQVASECGCQILDLPFTDKPTPDDLIDALAFKTIIENPDDTTGTTGDPYIIWEHAIPDHPVYRVVLYDSANGLTQTTVPCYIDMSHGMSLTMGRLEKLEAFSIRPLLYITDIAATPITRTGLGELNFHTVIGVEQLRALFDWYFLGLFDAEVKGVKPF